MSGFRDQGLEENRTDFNVSNLLSELGRWRPVFHSEADFQHALAWQIQLAHPDASVRLEFKPPKLPPRSYMDIWAIIDGRIIAIELKYKTRPASVTYDGEAFALQSHGAQDLGRYDFLKDVCRVEQAIHGTSGATGYAILLTNDSAYWSSPGRTPETIDSAFRIHHGSEVAGQRAWARITGTAKGRETALALRGAYRLEWNDYSDLDAGTACFRYACVSVTP